MGIFEKLFSKALTIEEFAKLILRTLKEQGASDLRYDEAARSIRVGSKDSTLYLDNAFWDYSSAEKSRRPEIVQKYVTSFLHSEPAPKDFAIARERLLPVVKDPAYFSLSRLLFETDGKDSSKLDYPTKGIADGLVAAIANDTETCIMMLERSTMEKWAMSLEELLEVATMNLRDKTDIQGMKEIVPGLFVSQFGDSYDSARILLPDFLHRLSLNGDPVVFVPNRDQLWVTGEYDKAAIQTILKHASPGHFELGHSLSPNLYSRRDGRWEVFLPEAEESRKAALLNRFRRLDMDYSQQQGYLVKKFQRENLIIFVAKYQLYKRKDESLFSRCVWSPVDALLPVTDYVVLTKEPNSKDFIDVEWEKALSIVGDLMELQPDLAPLRYRVRTFPSAEQFETLRSVAAPDHGSGSPAEAS